MNDLACGWLQHISNYKDEFDMKWFIIFISAVVIMGIAYFSSNNLVFATLIDSHDTGYRQEIDETHLSESDLMSSVDIFNNTLQFTLPQDWQLAFSSSEKNMTTSEFISNQRSLGRWSEMICVQGFKGMGRHASPDIFFNEVVNAYKRNCQGELIYQQLGDTQFAEQEAFHALLGCSSLPDLHPSAEDKVTFKTQLQGEMGYFAVVSLDDDLMMLHKSMRGTGFSVQNAPLTKANYQSFIAHLKPKILLSNHE
jgi:hypothetical protein